MFTFALRFCADCVEADPKRVITMKPPARKSSRKRTQLDYANLDSGLQSDPNRWTRMLEGKKIKDDNFQRMRGSEVDLEWLDSNPNAMREPFIVEKPEGLGMKMPDGDFSVDTVADVVGEDTPVEVIGTPVYVFSDIRPIDSRLHRCRISIQLPRMDSRQMGRILQP